MVTHIFKDGSQSHKVNKKVPKEIVERVREIANRKPVNVKEEWRNKWEKNSN